MGSAKSHSYFQIPFSLGKLILPCDRDPNLKKAFPVPNGKR
ncbi:hypothetical protein [Leptospira tipperaryensis]|nr:hypothetical protein [Leptospira tipperaryensis]